MASLKLYWDSVQGAANYNIYWDTSPGVTIASPHVIIGVTDIFFHHINLLEDTTYYYIVAAVDDGGILGPPSVEFSARTSVINGIIILPVDAIHLAGETQQYVAELVYSSGGIVDVTTLAAWDTSNHGLATISSGGLATAISIGTVNIMVTYDGYSNSTPLEIHHTLLSITITPSSPLIHNNDTLQMTATGHYNDATTADITNTVSWNSSDISKATIGTFGLATGVSTGTTLITATLGAVNASIVLTVDTFISITVTPNPATIFYAGNTLQFIAIGTFSDFSTQDITGTSTWVSSTPGVATISSTGLATAVSIGTTNITAQHSLITSSAVTATVPSWALQSNPGGTDIMAAVVGNSDGQIIAGGSTFGGLPVIWRWDGITWGSVVRSNVFSSQDAVKTVHTSLDNTTFFASTSHNIAKSTDGGVTWYQLSDPTSSGGVGGVVALDANTIWTYSGIFGTSFFYQSLDGGSTWVAQSAGQTDSINDFFMLNASSIYAFGHNSAGTAGVIWHYNGSAWTKLTTTWTDGSTAPLQNVTSMWGDADNDMYAGGIVGSVVTPHVLIRSTDQFATFIPQIVPVLSPTISSINGLDGYTGGADNLHKIIYFTASNRLNFEVYKHQPGIDTAETFVSAGAALGTSQSAQDVWINPATLRAVAVGAQTTEQFGVYTPTLTSISITPTTSNTKAFQQFYCTGTFSDSSVRDVTNSVTWNSSNTSAATIASSGLATSVLDGGTTNITATYSALTSNTAVMNTNTWIQQASGTANKLNGVWGFSASNVYAVGNTGTILHWNGSSWSTQTIATSDNIMRVQGSDAGNVYIYTETNHVYVSHDGSTWTQKTNPGTGSSISSIWATSSTDIWIAGGGRFVHSADDGGSWTADVGNVATAGGSGFIGFSSSDIWSCHSGDSELMKYDGAGTNGNAWHDWPNNTLAVAISPSDTSITLTDATYFPKVGAIRIDPSTSNESITYTGKSGNTLTGCTRGQNFTTATSHSIGAFVTGFNSLPRGFGTSAIWGTSDSDLFLAGAFFNGGGIFHSTDRFATLTGVGPDNGFVPSSISPVTIFGGNNFVYAAGTTQSNHFAIISYDRSKNQWTTTFDQNISANSARGIWTDSSTGYTVAVGDGGTIVKKG